MTFRVTVRQFDRPVSVEIGQTILAAALDQGQPYPCGCQSGNCGACKSVLVAGEVDMAPYSPFALSAEERQSGRILACRAVPWSDCEVAYLEPDEAVSHPRRLLDCRVLEIAALTHDIKRVRLEIAAGGPFDFTAGQYGAVTFAGLAPRDYSFANLPDEAILEFHIRVLDGGAVSRHVARDLAPGAAVRVEGPFGVSYLREGHRGPILAIAGGSGMAPIRSIVGRALAAGLAQPIHVYVGMRDERDVYLERELAELAARHPNLGFDVVLSEPTGPTDRRTGLLCDVLADDFTDLDGAKVYLAGPPVMVETCVSVLDNLGVRREDCHADAFYSAHELAAGGRP